MSENLNRVFFDGNELSYKVNGVQVINGEFPTEYELKGDYLINAGDLAIIESILNSKKGSIVKHDFCNTTIYALIVDKDSAIETMIEQREERIEKLKKEMDECYALYENIIFQCKIFNKLPWYKRIFKKVELNEK